MTYKQQVLIILPWGEIGPAHVPSTERIEETQGLVRAVNAEVAGTELIKVRKISSGQLLGSGQLEDIKLKSEALNCDTVLFDIDLTGIQQRNIQQQMTARVADRTGLILEIFADRARTSEGKLQVELAHAMYEKSRLVRAWTHLERQRGGGGFLGGAGEKQLEVDRRLVDTRLKRLRRELGNVKKRRQVTKAKSRENVDAVVALAGYTNAGKSTLFNRLCNMEKVVAKDMPFTTLDPTRSWIKTPQGRMIEIVDTVGFISDIPHDLIDAFKATFESVLEADLLLHVQDISSPRWQEQEDDVLKTLEEIAKSGDSDIPYTAKVLNKCDIGEFDVHSQKTSKSVAISALTGQGMDNLMALIDEFIIEKCGIRVRRLRIPVEDGKTYAWLQKHGHIISETLNEANGLDIAIKLDNVTFRRLQKENSGLAILA